MEAIELTLSDEGVGFGFSQVDALFQAGYENAPAEAVRDLLDLQRVRGIELSALGWEGLGQLNQWLNDAQGGPNEALVLAALADFGYSGIRLQGEGGKGNYVFISDDSGGVLQGMGGNDLILGGDGDDWLDGGSNNDIMQGGKGDDTYVVDSVDDVVIEHADEGIDTVESNVSYTLGDNVENLTLLGHKNLSGTGNELNNIIRGNSGDNYLDGGTGEDTLIGGRGNDTYVVNSAGDQVIERMQYRSAWKCWHKAIASNEVPLSL
ncbi:calcium-binding protein [Thiopseudomonas denitrificans]